MTAKRETDAKNDASLPVNRWIGLGVAAGVGSAAIAAALLYTNRVKTKDKPSGYRVK